MFPNGMVKSSVLNAHMLKGPRQSRARRYGLSQPRHFMFDVIDDLMDELLVAELSRHPGFTLRDAIALYNIENRRCA